MLMQYRWYDLAPARPLEDSGTRRNFLALMLIADPSIRVSELLPIYRKGGWHGRCIFQEAMVNGDAEMALACFEARDIDQALCNPCECTHLVNWKNAKFWSRPIDVIVAERKAWDLKYPDQSPRQVDDLGARKAHAGGWLSERNKDQRT